VTPHTQEQSYSHQLRIGLEFQVLYWVGLAARFLPLREQLCLNESHEESQER